MANPDNETIILINDYDAMSVEEKKKHHFGEHLCEDDFLPPYFTFSTSKPKVWARFLRRIGGLNALIKYDINIGWWNAYVPMEYLHSVSFGVKSKSSVVRPKRTVSAEHLDRLKKGRKK